MAEQSPSLPCAFPPASVDFRLFLLHEQVYWNLASHHLSKKSLLPASNPLNPIVKLTLPLPGFRPRHSPRCRTRFPSSQPHQRGPPNSSSRYPSRAVCGPVLACGRFCAPHRFLSQRLSSTFLVPHSTGLGLTAAQAVKSKIYLVKTYPDSTEKILL